MARPPAVGYVRVSTTEQVKGFGLDVQERAIRDFCKANGLRLVGVYRDEGVSGSNGLDSRVGLAEALTTLKDHQGAQLVVYRLDRLARDLILQETLVERLRDEGTPVRSASEPDLDTDTDDPTKTLIRQIVGAVAQYERTVIRGRMMAGKAAKKAAGGYVGGGLAYGWRLEDGQVVQDKEEQRSSTLWGAGRSPACHCARSPRARVEGIPATLRRILAPEHRATDRGLHDINRGSLALSLACARVRGFRRNRARHPAHDPHQI